MPRYTVDTPGFMLKTAVAIVPIGLAVFGPFANSLGRGNKSQHLAPFLVHPGQGGPKHAAHGRRGMDETDRLWHKVPGDVHSGYAWFRNRHRSVLGKFRVSFILRRQRVATVARRPTTAQTARSIRDGRAQHSPIQSHFDVCIVSLTQIGGQ